MKKVILSTAIVVASVFSVSSFADTVRLSDGTSCSVDMDDSNMELTLGISQDDGWNNNNGYNHYNSDHGNGRISAELTYKFGTPKRMDCNALFEMELEKRKLELELTRKKLELMQSAGDIQW